MPSVRRISPGTESLRLGLIGAGGYGARHLQTMEFLPEKPGAKLVAVADPYRERYPLLESRLASNGVRWHLSMESMLNEEALDAVIIAAPIPRHFAMAKLALRHGLYVYLEKPPVPLIQQLEELIALDRDHRVVVGFQLIHSAPIRRLKQVILDGKLGEVLSIRGGASAPRRQSYYRRASWAGKMLLGEEPVFDGPMTNALAHILQNILYLGGADERSYGRPREVRGELYRSAPIESYDSAALGGTLDSGITFAFAGTHASAEILPHTLEVQGTKGSVRLEGEALRASVPGLSLETTETVLAPLERSYHTFLNYLSGDEDAFVVKLEDTRGYTLATNGSLISSRGIHEIPASATQNYEMNGDQGVNVEEMTPLIRRCIDSGKLFSEEGPQWAVASESLPLGTLRSVFLEEWMAAPLESGTPVAL